ncbi:MAG TPA: hypothetical protein VKA30_10405, partial [Actinomycetota bacterium]|nr:hypothetical protein [Actinomycetota bacterium]
MSARRRLITALVAVTIGAVACGSAASNDLGGPVVPAGALSPVGALVRHGQLSPHRPLVLPARKPYGVRSDRRYLTLFARPGDADSVLHLDTHNPLGQQFALPVTTIRPQPDGSAWLRVLLPDDTRGPSAWVRTDDVRVITLRE